jgi:PAS domain S-box-containing protein
MADAHDELRFAYDRAVDLLEAAIAAPELDLDRARSVLHEMVTIVEELRVTDEELRVQSEQLASSAGVIDAERARFAELFDAAPDAYVETDRYGKIIEANRAAEEALGVPRRLLYGKLLVSFVEEDDRRRLRRRLGNPDATGETILGMVGRHGRRFEAGMTIAEGSNEATGVVYRWIFRDVTERLALQDEVSFLSERLELSNAIVELSRLTSRRDPLASLLSDITDLASSVISADVGMTLLDREYLESRVATGELARELDARQRSLGMGPCFEAIRTHRVVHGEASEWPAFTKEARAGALSEVIAVPLAPDDGEPVGALNVYAREPLGERAVELVVQIARQCAVVFENTKLYSSASKLAGELAQAMESRGIIEQAKGILMARDGCDADAAIDILKRASQRENVKLREIAKRIVDRATTVDLAKSEREA